MPKDQVKFFEMPIVCKVAAEDYDDALSVAHSLIEGLNRQEDIIAATKKLGATDEQIEAARKLQLSFEAPVMEHTDPLNETGQRVFYLHNENEPMDE